MIGPGEAILALIIVGLPVVVIGHLISRWFKLKEKKLEIDARMAAEKAAQYVARSQEIEQRLAVIERIVTDRPAALAREIDSLAIADQAKPKKDMA